MFEATNIADDYEGIDLAAEAHDRETWVHNPNTGSTLTKLFKEGGFLYIERKYIVWENLSDSNYKEKNKLTLSCRNNKSKKCFIKWFFVLLYNQWAVV